MRLFHIQHFLKSGFLFGIFVVWWTTTYREYALSMTKTIRILTILSIRFFVFFRYVLVIRTTGFNYTVLPKLLMTAYKHKSIDIMRLSC